MENSEKKLIEILKDIKMEFVLLNLLIILDFIFIDIGHILAVGLFLLIVLIKIYKKNFLNSLWTLNLYVRRRQSPYYMLSFVFNILALILILSALVTRTKIYFIVFLLLRLCLEIERQVSQNIILSDAIKKTANFEKIEIDENFATQKTVKNLKMLDNISLNINQMIQEKMENEMMKVELITNISHDLKTPLTSIINYADLLEKKKTLDEEAKEYINILGRNSRRLKSRIIDLIYAARTNAKNIKVEKEIIEFNELVNQTYGDFISLFEKNNLDFIYDSDKENIFIYSDGNLVSRVIQNLLSNAYKYSLKGTRIYSKTTTDENNIYFSIKNTSAEKLNISAEELMKELVKVDRSRTKEGSGLGLYISKNLVEILGGKFELVIDGDYFQTFISLPIEGSVVS